ncbi:phage terminase small subunit [Paenibacillus polymyxa]|uniref:phage terminase small subunit n=1 Tax=Paenibacillus polymyxa TaxID=1406 RepID=UPI00307FAB89
MARERSPERDTAKKIWLESGGVMKLKAIAADLGVGETQVRKWKSQDRWSDELKGNVTESNRNVTKGPGAPYGNKNALGNSGGSGGPPRNDKAVTHGFFRKFLPDDTAEIMNAIEDRSPLDMIWDQIMIQYAAILRAQQIMFVKDSEDVTKVLTESADNAFGGSEKWEYQHAWDKHAAFMNAQSRAMTTLQGLIKRYEEMCRLGYADEEQQLRISKLKAEVASMDKAKMVESVVFKDDLHE